MAKDNRWIKFESWRLPVFILITAATASLGFYLKSAADPGAESKQFASQAPLTLDFYVSNPDMSLSIQLFIYQMNHSDKVSVFVQVPNNDNGDILALSSLPDQGGQLHRLTPPKEAPYVAHIGQPYISYYANVLKNASAVPQQIENNFSVEEFDFTTSKVIDNTDSSSYGHLPSINALYDAIPYQDEAPCILSNVNSAGRISKIYIDPYGTVCLHVPGRGIEGAFFPTTQVSTAEVLTGIAPEFKTEEVNYINPPGDIDGGDYVWESASSLEPIFELTNQDAIQAESNNGFMAGIAFGVAGGAAVAVVQEIPRRKRKSTSRYTRPLAYFFMLRLRA